MSTYQYIKHLIKGVEELDIIKEIYNLSGSFYDEPRYYYFTSVTGPSTYYKKAGYVGLYKIDGGGLSFDSPEKALLKSFGEGLERFVQCIFHPEKKVTASYEKLKKRGISALNPSLFGFLKNAEKIKIGWVEGFVPKTNEKVLIPAQLAYLTWRKYADEPFLTENITTGAAAGATKEQALLSGLYEAIERDATMSSYLNHIPLSPIDLTTIDDKRVQKIVNSCYRYKIAPYIFEATNDVRVPVYITILLDKSNGPAITIGSRADLDRIAAVYHSIEEAFMGRIYIRRTLLKEPDTSLDIRPEQIVSNKVMYLYWSSRKRINKLHFLLQNKPVPFHNKKNYNSLKIALEFVLKRLQILNMSTFAVNLTLPELKKSNMCIYKIIVPDLQPLYIDQTRQFFNYARLKQVANFFRRKPPHTYTFPHPFP